MITYTPHEIDLDLLDCAKKVLNNLKKNDPRRIILKSLLHQYEVACVLNKGPDLSRSKDWNTKAYILHDKLRKLEVDIYVNE